jgi:hypothetical protein
MQVFVTTTEPIVAVIAPDRMEKMADIVGYRI